MKTKTSNRKSTKKTARKPTKAPAKAKKRITRARKAKVTEHLSPPPTDHLTPKEPIPVAIVTGDHEHQHARTSSREYECFCCGKTIQAGTEYSRTAFKYDRGGFNVFKERACPACADVIERIGAATGLRPSPLGAKDYLTDLVSRGELGGEFVTMLADLNARFKHHGRETLTVFQVERRELPPYTGPATTTRNLPT